MGMNSYAGWGVSSVAGLALAAAAVFSADKAQEQAIIESESQPTSYAAQKLHEQAVDQQQNAINSGKYITTVSQNTAKAMIGLIEASPN
jgi:hypothetical protein